MARSIIAFADHIIDRALDALGTLGARIAGPVQPDGRSATRAAREDAEEHLRDVRAENARLRRLLLETRIERERLLLRARGCPFCTPTRAKA